MVTIICVIVVSFPIFIAITLSDSIEEGGNL